MGWFVTAPRTSGVAVRSQQIIPRPRRPVVRPVANPGAEPTIP